MRGGERLGRHEEERETGIKGGKHHTLKSRNPSLTLHHLQPQIQTQNT
jgi:hypothetical protein